MQDAALFVGVVGHIVVSLRGDGEFAQQGVAMVAMVIHGIHAVGGMVLGAGKEFMLRCFRPMLVAVFLGAIAGRVAVVLALHFLQKNNISIEESDRLLQCMNPGQAPHGGDALVYIISCYADFHALILLPDGPRTAPG